MNKEVKADIELLRELEEKFRIDLEIGNLYKPFSSLPWAKTLFVSNPTQRKS